MSEITVCTFYSVCIIAGFKWIFHKISNCLNVLVLVLYRISPDIRQSFLLPKQSQRSRSVLLDGSRSLGLFRKDKIGIMAKFHRTDLVIWSHSTGTKTPSYSRINTVCTKSFIYLLQMLLIVVQTLLYTSEIETCGTWWNLWNRKELLLIQNSVLKNM